MTANGLKVEPFERTDAIVYELEHAVIFTALTAAGISYYCQNILLVFCDQLFLYILLNFENIKVNLST